MKQELQPDDQQEGEQEAQQLKQDAMQQGVASTPSAAKDGSVTLALPRPTPSTVCCPCIKKIESFLLGFLLVGSGGNLSIYFWGQGKARKLDMVLKIKMRKEASESEVKQVSCFLKLTDLRLQMFSVTLNRGLLKGLLPLGKDRTRKWDL